jgi:oxalate decarboxylase/phosphoglucose isomerase-like protein (cupin superfamily)
MNTKKMRIKPFFVDKRGEISSFFDNDINIKSVLLIKSKKNEVRANHFHKKDEHYTYLISGRMEYFYKLSNGKLKKILLKNGEMVYTPRLEKHAMKFLEDSIFIAFSIRRRDRKTYELDTVREEII